MAEESDLLKLKPKSPSQILEALAKSRKKGLLGPLTSLHLRSGRDIIGRVLRFEEELGQPGALLLFQMQGPSQNDDDVVYLDAVNIEAVTVHGAKEHLQVLEPAQFPGL